MACALLALAVAMSRLCVDIAAEVLCQKLPCVAVAVGWAPGVAVRTVPVQ